ncbi:hypothetical protein ZOSMA_255G00120 [Zostera marina]|uniref:Uncharacterized protein n=1 Tax=Zostera marina TaxID=29655 RepID=A0A0K9PFW7_ZOSMR|nr:hypothetical protein ZOSMA_255G00120 [Zostera marina]
MTEDRDEEKMNRSCSLRVDLSHSLIVD